MISRQSRKKKPTKEYWKQRFTALENRENKSAAETYAEVQPAFEAAKVGIQKEIELWLQRMAKNNEISMSEAKELLDKNELDEFHWDVEEYIKHGEENELDQSWMKQLENASAKFHITKLDALLIHMQQYVESAYGKEQSAIESLVSETYQDTYYRTAYEIMKGNTIGWDIGTIDKRKLDQVVKKPWAADGSNFSDRIWKNKAEMVSVLQQELTQACIKGGSPDAAIEALTQFLKGKVKNAELTAARLVQTEQAAIASEAQKDCFKDLDVEEFEIVVTLDNHTCDTCGDMDGKHLPMSDFETGITAPPFHPFCRCTTVPYFDDEWSKGERAARNDDEGKTYHVPSDMTFNQWKNRALKGQNEFTFDESPDIDWLPQGKKISIEEYKELRDYANSKGITLRGFKDSDVDLELAHEAIDDASSMLEQFPELTGDAKHPFTLELKTLPNKDFARSQPTSPNVIQLNRDAFRNKDKLQEEYQKLVDSKWFVKGSDYHSIIKHECGHIFADQHHIDSMQMMKDILKTDSSTVVLDKCSEILSDYSAFVEDGSEIVSEMFSAYYSGSEDKTVLTFMNMCFNM